MTLSTYSHAAAGALLLVSLTAFAQKAPDGVIHFIGAVVEDACTVENSQTHVAFSCYRDGKFNRQTLAVNHMNEVSLKAANATAQMKWLDNAHRLGVLQVDYQ